MYSTNVFLMFLNVTITLHHNDNMFFLKQCLHRFSIIVSKWNKFFEETISKIDLTGLNAEAVLNIKQTHLISFKIININICCEYQNILAKLYYETVSIH